MYFKKKKLYNVSDKKKLKEVSFKLKYLSYPLNVRKIKI